MAPPRRHRQTYTEADVLLAVDAIRSDRIKHVSKAAATYKVPQPTLWRRLNGTPARRDTKIYGAIMTKPQEDKLVNKLLELDGRGFGATLTLVREMADSILQDAGKPPTGKNWVYRFLKRRPELKTTRSRPYDYQRALCEDPDVLKKWFDIILTKKTEYGIYDDDIYNFDETGFMMGKIQPAMIVTGTERKKMAKKIQPGNRDWATVVACGSSTGYTTPPFIILAGKEHLEAWYQVALPRATQLELSESGWINTGLALKWLDFFDLHTKNRSKGAYRMLVMDGHDTHVSDDFLAKCKVMNIIPVCMPGHSSHLCQPMDVSVFGPFKRAYNKKIEKLVRSRTTNVDKVDFLEAIKDAIPEAFTEKNVRSGFEAAGIVPLDPQRVLSQLTIRHATPEGAISNGTASGPWTPKTPHTARDFHRHSRYLRERALEHPNSSPTQTNEGFERLEHGIEAILTGVALMKQELDDLRGGKARKERKTNARKTRLKEAFSMTFGQAQDRVNQMALDRQIQQEASHSGSGPGERRRRSGIPRYCGFCKNPGHNVRTCPNHRVNRSVTVIS
jgi:hypothetical protein